MSVTREIQKLLSKCICSVLVVLKMWGSWAPTTIMLTQPLAHSNFSSISAFPPLLLPPIFTHVSTGALSLEPSMIPQCPQDKP